MKFISVKAFWCHLQAAETLYGEVNLLKRKLEEYDMLLRQKDESVQVLMVQLQEAEELKDKVEDFALVFG